jgi:diguanylate cyclase (GGDEF)-like protein
VKIKDNTTGLKLKSSRNLTGYDLKSSKNVHEPFFVQALLSPKKNELFYVMDSCASILAEKKIIALYERILIELTKCLHASEGAFYLYVKKDDFFELINYQGIDENKLSDWETISESIKNELQVNEKAFYGVSNDKKVDLNSLIVPIRFKGKIYAIVKLSSRQGLSKFTKFDINIANQMIDFINMAINTLKAPAAKEADDTLRLHEKRTFKLSYFYEFISNELRRARRYNKTFSLICFKVDNYNSIKKKVSEATLKRHINDILDKLNLTIRETDFIAEESNSQYFIVLPETDYFGSLMTMRKIDANISNDLVVKEGKKLQNISIKMSSASFPKDGTNAKSILKALSIRLDVAKKSITERLDLKNVPFWDLLAEFIGNEDEYTDKDIDKKKLSILSLNNEAEAEKGTIRFSTFHPQTLRQLESIIFHEASINSDRKGVMYVGRSSPIHTFSVLKKLPDIEYSNTRISLITKECNKEVLFPNFAYIFTPEDNILNHYFIVYLNEKYAYGLFAKKSPKGVYYGFHTSDSIFIENLIVRLQNYYMLQEQL